MNKSPIIFGTTVAAIVISYPCLAQASPQALSAAQQLNQFMSQSADIYLYAVQTQNAQVATQQFHQLYHNFINWTSYVTQNIDKRDFNQALNEVGTSALQEYAQKMQQAAQHGLSLAGRNYIVANRGFMHIKQAFDSAFHYFVASLRN